MRKILETTAEQEQSSFHHVTDPSMVERQRTSSTNGPGSVSSQAFLCLECGFCAFILHFVPYTEIDWKAYMQEVTGFLDGERNYYNLKGDTGPLVYPAGFVYIFAALKYLTQSDPAIAQGIFAGFYLLQIALTLKIYESTINRLHSIYMLRCFNDGVAMLFTYASILAAQKRRWVWCCVLYSLGVSVKMNVLLFAPALLWLLWEEASHHNAVVVLRYLSLCGAVQGVLALPFLIHNPIAYLHRSFELTRVFQYKWTVNWRFVPEVVFLSKAWGLALLLSHITLLMYLWRRVWVKDRLVSLNESIFKTYVPFVFFSCNFVGILFARSLHYQFYSWYYPSLPFLLCHLPYKSSLRIAILLAVEYCWNVYPQRPEVSFLLFVAHLILLVGIFVSPLKNLWRKQLS